MSLLKSKFLDHVDLASPAAINEGANRLLQDKEVKGRHLGLVNVEVAEVFPLHRTEHQPDSTRKANPLTS